MPPRYKKAVENLEFSTALARLTGFEPVAYRVGVLRQSNKKAKIHAYFSCITQIAEKFDRDPKSHASVGETIVLRFQIKVVK